MRNLLLGMVTLAMAGMLVGGCNPQTDTPPLEDQSKQAKTMPGANTPAATTNVDPNAVKKAKTGD